MADKPEEKISFWNDVPKLLIGAIIPIGITFIFSFLGGFLFPRNEIRFVPSQEDSGSVYLIIENHRRDTPQTFAFSSFGTPQLKLLRQSDYAEEEVKTSGNDFYMLRISNVLPGQRTTFVLHADRPISGINFELVSAPPNTFVIPAGGLEGAYMTASTYISLAIQSIIYLIMFYFLNLYMRKRQKENAHLNNKLDEARNALQSFKDKHQTAVSDLESKIKSVQNIAAKDRILTRRLYDQIEQENRFWRMVLSRAIGVLIGQDRRSNLDFVRSILKGAGIKRKEGLVDVNLEFLLQKIENEEDYFNVPMAEQIMKSEK